MGLLANCHCGAVQLKLAMKPEDLTICNCSICHRYGVQWAYYEPRHVEIKCSEGALAVYSWGKKDLQFFHCKTCGCITHYDFLERHENNKMAVNARLMNQADVVGIPIREFDGADTWKYLK